ncbi:cytochrome P450 [Pleomassaria siparia CBS 279.74]|uniref:Cytochrome P450 n=1 Tax=Pleomassaria siparia CBS 279.74 TaxID=1314801 RepID=A0A6G1KHM9_9PLEO|nr:cytochrome P450 [Pleomassaria siparia CBS 279.74]
MSLVLLLGVTVLPLVFLKTYIIPYLRSPLKSLPGPFFAKFTNLWRLFSHYKQTHIETQQALHDKYGDAVRIGPNVVSIADPALVKTIYSTRGTFIKSEYYSVNDALQDGHLIPNIFSTRSNVYHARALKPMAKLYSFSSALELEPSMDVTLRTLFSQLETRFMDGANAGKTCDISEWFSFFTWDFLADVTFSERMGFLERGEDVGDMIETGEKVMRYFSVVGQIPTLDKLLGKNPHLPYKFADFSVTAGFCTQRFLERVQLPDEEKQTKKDFMASFMQAKREYPELVGDDEIIGILILNVLGGADTSSIILKAVLYHMLRNPLYHHTLVAELRASLPSPSPRTTPSPSPSSSSSSHHYPLPLSHAQTSTLPYLQACILETLRFHPVLGHVLERVVPSSGLTLSSGVVLPPGTIVGVNPWVMSRSTLVYGPDASTFRPGRWLRDEGVGETEEAHGERVARMKSADLAWGGGNRVCLGRPLAMVQVAKVVASLFAYYDLALEDPTQEWHLHKQWLVLPHKIRIKIARAPM